MLVVAVLAGALLLGKGFATGEVRALVPGKPAVHPSPTTSPRPSTHPSTRRTPPVRGVTVHVLNGTTTPGLAATEKKRLIRVGFKVPLIGTAATHYTVTTIYYVANAKASADYLKSAFYPTALVKPATAAIGTVQQLTLIIGADFSGAP